MLRMPHTLATSDFGGPSAFDVCLMEQLDLCRRLEDLADTLPSRIDTRSATLLASRLRSTLRRCHRLEETVVFPILLSSDIEVHPILDRLRHEHQEDEDHACEVQESIQAFVTASNRENAEELGYMLRCLFVSLRRHLAFDRDYVLPLIQRAEKL